jgi:heat shock protein HslJ
MLSIFLAIGFAACGTTNSNPALVSAKWFLRSYGEGGNLISIIEDSEITISFDSNKGRVNGSAGCNTYFGSYETMDNRLTISEMAYTERACLSPEGVMEQEQEYLFNLGNARFFQVDDTALTIFSSAGLQLYFTTDAEIQ